VPDQRETKQTVKFDPQTMLWAEPKPTALIERDRLRELIDASTEPEPQPLAHTIRREKLRVDREPMLDTDIRPSLSPILVAAVIALLIVAFIAATHVR
jgi:hypothetical protein